jgi:MFS family permease
LFLSGASFFAAAVAGRLTEKVPVKWLIGPGFLVLGLGLLLMLGIQSSSSWTHLIPGLLVAGVGIGLINPPLASTAVGVVPVERSGMASGVNSTLRQVGIATGIAALGSLFSQQVADAARPELASKVPPGAVEGLTAALSGGQVQPAAEAAQRAATAAAGPSVGQQAFDLVERVGTSTVVDALNHIFLIAAVIAFVAGVLSLALIRQQDFVIRTPPVESQADEHQRDRAAI